MLRKTIWSLLYLICLVPFWSVAAEKLPHFFPEGVEKINRPSRQWEAFLQYVTATEKSLGTPRYPHIFSSSMLREETIDGQKIKFIFDMYVPMVSDSTKITFYDLSSQRIVSPEEFKIATDYFINQVKQAIDYAYDYHREVEEDAVKLLSVEENIPQPKLRLLLPQELPEAPRVTYRGLQQLPKSMKKADFVPHEVHLGYGGFFGAAWLNSGVIYITPQALIVDYIFGFPRVVIHELTHANPNLQSYPMSDGMDVELLASLPEMLMSEDKISLIYHPYMRDVREMIHVFFGFDFDQAKDEVVLFDHAGNIRFDEAKFDLVAEKLEKVKKELHGFYRHALPHYYADQIYWLALHEKLNDKAVFFRFMMAFNYDPTLLGGHEKTMIKLEALKPEILKMADESFKASNKSLDSNNHEHLESVISQTTKESLLRILNINEEDLIKLFQKSGLTPSDLQGKSPGEIFEILQRVIRSEQEQMLERR